MVALMCVLPSQAEAKAWVKKKIADSKAHRERKQQTREQQRDVDEL